MRVLTRVESFEESDSSQVFCEKKEDDSSRVTKKKVTRVESRVLKNAVDEEVYATRFETVFHSL